jgi:cytoskeleton protein RodZ
MRPEILDLSAMAHKDLAMPLKIPSTEDPTNALMAVPTGPSVGQQLRAAREAKSLSVSDVAQALKLSEHQVHALEADDWLSLPGTIARGFIRNYARLLHLNSDALMSQLDSLRTPQPPSLDLVGGNSTALPSAIRVERRDWAVMFSGLILVTLALLAYFFVPQDFWLSKLTPLAPLVQEAKTVAPMTENAVAPSSVTADQAVPLGGMASAESEASKSSSLIVAEERQPVDRTASGTGRLQLHFARPSWVEIRDRNSQIIFSQLNPAGSEREIEGLPPFALVIGNASGVTVHYKGKAVEIPLRSKDDVARLSLE